jgi:hypothetical protein
MAKRDKRSKSDEAGPAPATHAGKPPIKRPMLLAASVVLFVLWFVFLLVTALWG